LEQGMKNGYKAFQVPLPPLTGRNQGQAFDKAVRARMDALRKAGGDGVDFVLEGAARLMAGDASSVAASLERFHLLWFDEPCTVSNLQTIRKLSDENVTPLGFGRSVQEASVFQDLLREGCVDSFANNPSAQNLLFFSPVAERYLRTKTRYSAACGL
jgi:galactonate dehydratase